ncbi:bifunctional methylenetetrahydrofolate dehydrogenase/methenyltetrahydrofolate cyclohydrolase FolD [Aurantimonas sp. VKM B-3413]|uniref:bifunctional methylenetetrahydrofolate dehydrogenase/methenyltetrahydrofolate cyclohydrolase FolD n=1 Tax=Aurantimonas sp. VKM B-3413 TaxID=2779401 RepID=UPI001E4A19C4|nr:bifunctional methylenetetrahydrofolate dehydrogenase/methenyltetrahydrofolate cyclohydrolase FolD [Aurantimonas sp. VKM B-3413]MCB8839212.1 bifunctional methylenetetrahydrofolate dehydrogenase/methenyltetrahydrofolate cyclohydrolase FolD [Aurantimonas sp. VKM B-3413]
MAEARRIDGKAVAATIIDRVKAQAQTLSSEAGVTPGLAVVIVGSDPASQIYVSSKAKMAAECGFHSEKFELPEDTSEAALLAEVARLNADPRIHGILVQLPLPVQIDEAKVIQAIDAAKDVDGFHLVNVGLLSTGAVDEAFVPCTPAGSMLLIRSVLGDDLSGKTAVVVGRSNIVGKPMAQLLLSANATVTIAHSRTRDLAAVCRSADILVAAVGRPQMITGDYVKDGAVVIDVGINRIAAPEKGLREDGSAKTRLVGDVHFASAAEKAAAITPVPGGVGPMTIAMLMANTLVAACRAAGREPPRF